MINQSERIQELIDRNVEMFDSPETIAVQPACALRSGRPDWDSSFIRVVARRPSELLRTLPAVIDGVPIRVIAATMEEQAAHVALLQQVLHATGANEAAAWRDSFLAAQSEAPRDYTQLTYKPLHPSKLMPITEPMRLTVHVSPDSGWPVLREFLAPALDWKVAMFDFTARHIYDRLYAAADSAEGQLSLCLGPNESGTEGTRPTGITEPQVVDGFRQRLGARFRFAWASVGIRRQFPSAYHIKVAVRDGSALWLSSGNWQSTNQPDKDFVAEWESQTARRAATAREMARSNREWHIVVENESLARILAAYIQKDMESADAETRPARPPTPEPTLPALEFVAESPLLLAEEEAPMVPAKIFPALVLELDKPIEVIPILTPDNYVDEVIKLIERSTKRLWFQNQSLVIGRVTAPGYRRLLDALRTKCWEIDDSRVIVRDLIRAQTLDVLRLLSRDGFPMDKIRVMKTCHTKGILVDSRWTLLGSHNWTNEGTQFNRDASLVIDDSRVTHYFEEVFDHDWTFLASHLSVDLDRTSATLPLPGEALSGERLKFDPRLDRVSTRD